MAKIHRQEKVIFDGCAVETLCEGPCRMEHQRIYDPETKDVQICPAYYRFTFEKVRQPIGSRKRGKKNKLTMKEIR